MKQRLKLLFVFIYFSQWTETLKNIKEKIEKKIDYKLSSVLGNLYRDQSDMVPWHSDNEVEFGVNPKIASISLGEERQFGLRKIPPEVLFDYILCN